MTRLVEKLNTLMKNKDLTCLALSHITGIPNTSLSTLLKGRTDKIDVVKLKKIADALGCSLDYLMNDDCDDITNDKNTYYLDKETAKIAEEIHKNSELRMLFDASKKIKKEDMQFVIDMINRFKNE